MTLPITIHSVILGCPKNRVDAETMLGAVPGGVVLVSEPQAADLVVINTCSFIKPAVEESVRVILPSFAAVGAPALLPVGFFVWRRRLARRCRTCGRRGSAGGW